MSLLGVKETMEITHINENLLLREVALVFPLGAVAEFGRGIARAYYEANDSVMHDSNIGGADKRFERGNLRRCYINTSMHQLEDSYGDKLKVKDVYLGKKGSNNHVEMFVGRYVVSCHHLAGSRKMPKPSKYTECNEELNLMLSQTELFPLTTSEPIQGLNSPFNLLVLHSESSDSSEVDTIDFVFPKNGKRLVTFSIQEVIDEQVVLANMEEDDLDELRDRHEEAVKNLSLG